MIAALLIFISIILAFAGLYGLEAMNTKLEEIKRELRKWK